MGGRAPLSGLCAVSACGIGRSAFGWVDASSLYIGEYTETPVKQMRQQRLVNELTQEGRRDWELAAADRLRRRSDLQ
jgi:hypothetical protein